MAGHRQKERFYDTIAGDFDRVANRYDLEKRLWVVFDDLLRGERLEGRLLLDAGCGTGWFSREAARRRARVVSLDIGAELLRQARKKSPGAPVQGDLLALPFPDRGFDLVVCSEAIEHTAAPRRAVGELLRVLKPSGALALTVPNRLWLPVTLLANRLGLRPYRGFEHYVGWLEVQRWIREAGARIERRFGFHIVPFVWPRLHPLLDYFDRFGKALGPVMLNIAVKARKS